MFDLIKKLKNKKAKRTLDTETKFIKYANPVLSVYLSELFNLFSLCVNEGTYPDPLKIAEVILIFKKKDRSKTTNYRPISILSQFNKVKQTLLGETDCRVLLVLCFYFCGESYAIILL